MKACIFDLDGTLTDTLDSLEYSVNETMKQIHMPQITKEQCRDFVGNGAKVLIEKALKAGGDEALDRLDEAMEVYGRVFDENCTYKVVPYKGIERMLETLKKQGIRLAVLSNKPDRQVGHVIKEILEKGFLTGSRGRKRAFRENRIPVRHLTLRTDWELRSQRQRISEIRKWILQRERQPA